MSKLRQKIWEVSKRLPVFEKESTGFKFKYTNLETIKETLVKEMEKDGLCYSHRTSAYSGCGNNTLVTTVWDKEEPLDTEFCELILPEDVKLAGMNDYQSLGSALTYFRRYNLITLFDIVGADQDVDGVTTSAKVKVTDYVKKTKELIATGKYTLPQMESWFNKTRGIMTDDQRVESKALILAMKK